MKRLVALFLVLLFAVACNSTADEPVVDIVDAVGTTITVYRSPN